MTNEQILKKAIEKVENKYVWGIEKDRVIIVNNNGDRIKSLSFVEYIFSHGFAKAFWKNEPIFCWRCKIPQIACATEGCGFDVKMNRHIYEIEGWQYHLQQLVLELDYFQYLKGFLQKKL